MWVGGGGEKRPRSAPRVSRAMHRILHRVRARQGAEHRTHGMRVLRRRHIFGLYNLGAKKTEVQGEIISTFFATCATTALGRAMKALGCAPRSEINNVAGL